MNFNFELILFYATLITGVLALIDVVYLDPGRRKGKTAATAISGYLSVFDFNFTRKAMDAAQAGKMAMPKIMEYARAFFPILLIVFLLRSFLYEPFRIPSGSLEPTLLMGDFILVNKFDYGVRLPVVHRKVVGSGEPKRGDILVFRWPPNPSIDFIKRVIGVPGDKISYINKELYINGQKIPQEYVQNAIAKDEAGNELNVIEKQEDLLGVKHKIYIDPARSGQDYQDIVVPEGMYFVMGDNRDGSADSRYWGFVPEQNIVGKAVLVWMSWNSDKFFIRGSRIARPIT